MLDKMIRKVLGESDMQLDNPKDIQKRSKRLIEIGNVARFEAFEKKVAKGGDPQLIAALQAQRFLFDIERLAIDNGVPLEERPKMWWMRSPYPGNFGDVLTPYLLWHLFGIAPRWTRARDVDGICVGSIIKVAGPGVAVWGAGTARFKDRLNPEAKYHAVRGPMTRDAVLHYGGKVDEIYGDPAVLLPEIYDPAVEPDADLGIIPHVLQYGGVAEKFAAQPIPGVKVISLLTGSFADIERVIRDIKSCRRILSSSLHGLIVAHAYGVPAQALRLREDSELGDSFKVLDYKKSVGIDDKPIVVTRRFTDFDWLSRVECVLPTKALDLQALKAAFPFPSRK